MRQIQAPTKHERINLKFNKALRVTNLLLSESDFASTHDYF